MKPASLGPVRRVRIERSGGLAGMAARGECDVSALSSRQQALLTRLIGRFGSEERPRSAGVDDRGVPADRFRWCVQLDCVDGTRHQFEVPDGGMPQELGALVQLSLP